MASGGEDEAKMSSKKSLLRCVSRQGDELESFRSCLRWLCLDQSDRCRAFLSWTLFLVLAIGVPSLSYFILSCPNCDYNYRRPFDRVVQLSLTSIATLSFFCLSGFTRKYGLRRFLFLDRLFEDSESVRQEYTQQLSRSFKLLSVFVLPCFAAECAYKIWWYCSDSSHIPFVGNLYASDAIACILELSSWLYRTSVFFLPCVLFHLTCHLQILRLQNFAQVFQRDCEVELILKEHMRIRRHLYLISHRFRAFLIWTLIIVTVSQFYSLLYTTKFHSDLNVFRAGELALCYVGLVIGLLICIRSATKITHKAQAITSQAAQWHACATIDAFEATAAAAAEAETPSELASQPFVGVLPFYADSDQETTTDDDVDNAKFMSPNATTMSFQKRQALVSYFENNRAGISVFGFMVDRSGMQVIFMIEMSLVLWLLGKTVGI